MTKILHIETKVFSSFSEYGEFLKEVETNKHLNEERRLNNSKGRTNFEFPVFQAGDEALKSPVSLPNILHENPGLDLSFKRHRKPKSKKKKKKHNRSIQVNQLAFSCESDDFWGKRATTTNQVSR